MLYIISNAKYLLFSFFCFRIAYYCNKNIMLLNNF